MTTITETAAPPSSPPEPTPHEKVTLATTTRAEWIKFWSLRSTMWTLVALVVVGAGLTGLVTWMSADWLASPESDESVGSFVTWGIMLAQVAAVVLGTIAVTNEYSSGLIRSTVAATPSRGTIMVAKSVVVASVLFVVGTITAFLGYGLAWLALDNVGVSVSLSDDGHLRSMFGSGLFLAVLGLFSLAFGFIVRHTAAAISLLFALTFVVGQMAMLLPGTWGEWVMKLSPGNAGAAVSTPVSFNPYLLEPWTAFAVFCAEAALLMALAYALFKRRDV